MAAVRTRNAARRAGNKTERQRRETAVSVPEEKGQHNQRQGRTLDAERKRAGVEGSEPDTGSQDHGVVGNTRTRTDLLARERKSVKDDLSGDILDALLHFLPDLNKEGKERVIDRVCKYVMTANERTIRRLIGVDNLQDRQRLVDKFRAGDRDYRFAAVLCNTRSDVELVETVLDCPMRDRMSLSILRQPYVRPQKRLKKISLFKDGGKYYPVVEETAAEDSQVEGIDDDTEMVERKDSQSTTCIQLLRYHSVYHLDQSIYVTFVPW